MNEPTPPKSPPPSTRREEKCAKFLDANMAVQLAIAAVGVALGAAGIYIGDTDDAPGAALIGILLMLGLLTLSLRMAWRRRANSLGHLNI